MNLTQNKLLTNPDFPKFLFLITNQSHSQHPEINCATFDPRNLKTPNFPGKIEILPLQRTPKTIYFPGRNEVTNEKSRYQPVGASSDAFRVEGSRVPRRGEANLPWPG